MISRTLAALPLFATAAGFGLLGITILLAGVHALETGCFVMRPNE